MVPNNTIHHPCDKLLIACHDPSVPSYGVQQVLGATRMDSMEDNAPSLTTRLAGYVTFQLHSETRKAQG